MSDWSLACPDWAARIQAGHSLLPEMPLLLRAEAERAVTIYNRLRLPDVPGRPALAQAGGEWQRDIVRALFGSWDGTERHIREIFALVPKKNAKTTAGAAISLRQARGGSSRSTLTIARIIQASDGPDDAHRRQ